MSKGGIVRWEKKEGESFAAGDLLLQVKTEKAQMDVNAPDDGVLVQILTPEGSQDVPVNAEIAIIAEEGDDISSIVPDPARERTESRVSNRVLVDSNDLPSKVTGSYVDVGVGFTLIEGGCHQEICKVDKTLICKGFWDDIDKVGRIHLPRRFGKTFNLDIMRMFFSPSLESKSMHYIPDNVIGADDISKLDTSQLYQMKREWLFRDSALKREDPDFFEEHFCKHPVLFLSFADCKNPTLSGFIRHLCDAMIRVFNNWVSDIEEFNSEFSAGAVRAKKKVGQPH
ncbi:pyridoxine biosynthesis protein [Coemansia sp. IMI 209127]|nr:pyridoxine biosynthesis protein [Coemansia sp. IMI 209127]